jgi:amidase
MRLIIFLSFLLPAVAVAQTPAAGRWVVKADFYGTDRFLPLELQQEGKHLSGRFFGGEVQGTLEGQVVHFQVSDGRGGTQDYEARLEHDAMTGTLVFNDAEDPDHPERVSFIATRVPTRKAGPPHRHEFVPTKFYRQFSGLTPPVLTVSPGDTIHTTTVDAGGQDEKSVYRVLGGNPQTGPFFVETAAPGDVLVVHVTRLRLNRDYALSDDFVVGRALDPDLAAAMKDNGATRVSCSRSVRIGCSR